MFEKLREIEARYNEINEELSRAETVNDAQRFRDLMREKKRLEAVVMKYREYLAAEKEMAGAADMMREETDADLRAMAEEEYYACRDRIGELTESIKILLLPRDPDDDKNVIVEIRAGAGGEEAALFAYTLYRMYTMYAETQRFKTELIGCNDTGLGGFKEVSFLVEGEGAFSKLKFESGVHRVQRVPETESQGRIHTSTVTVAVLPEAEEVEIELKESDVKMETIKSTGAGGQHINKTESAVRLTHIPSGIIIECQEERSQFKNRDKAMKMLRTKLYDIKRTEQSEKIASQRKSQVGTGDRSERIRTYNYPQGRVTDHRIGLTLHSLEDFLNGDIGGMIEALITADTAAKLAAKD